MKVMRIIKKSFKIIVYINNSITNKQNKFKIFNIFATKTNNIQLF